jgi:predicted neuraminidase
MSWANLAVAAIGMATAAVGAAQVPPPLTPVGTHGVVRAELIFALEGRPTPQCHASTIAETSDGLIAVWFAGTAEKNPDVGIWVARQERGQWSKPVQVADGSEGENQDYACWNPVIFQPRGGPLQLYYKVGIDPNTWWGMVMNSTDGGRTWSPPRRLGNDPKIGPLIGPVKNKPIQLADGTIVAPSSTEIVTNGEASWRTHFELSRDEGRTWEVIGPINDGIEFDAIQPSVLAYANGDLQALMRTQQGVLAQSWSRDRGRTWSRLTATHLPNPNASADAVDLADGRKLLVYNHAVRRGDPQAKDGSYSNGRQILNVALSRDGQGWRPVLTLEQEGDAAGYSYPAVIQGRDGRVHITYTWRRLSIKHVVLDPAKLP